MTERGYPLFIEQLKLITHTTKALNDLGACGALDDEHHYLHVELRDTEGRVVGEWNDEHDGTAWEFSVSAGKGE